MSGRDLEAGELFEVRVEGAAGEISASARATFARLKAAGWRVVEDSGTDRGGPWERITAEKRFATIEDARAEFRASHAGPV